jgi:hypothetical protein
MVTTLATTVDNCAARLQAAGWLVGESRFVTDTGLTWQVDGANGENGLLARAPTQAGAWRAAMTHQSQFTLKESKNF